MNRRASPVAGILALAMLGGVGCHRSLVRLEAQGEHAEVIERANAKRWPPRRAAARAFAKALVHEGDAERARDVLLGDYRRGGQLRSLVSLADLERGLGRDGIAASHYARVIAGDRTLLRDRADVCALFDERAASWVAVGEGGAALDDLDRVRMLCGGDDPTLRRRAEDQLRAAIRRRTSTTRARVPVASPPPVAQTDATPTLVRNAALARGASLDGAEVVSLLLADLRGEAGSRLVDDDELRQWLGDVEPSALREHVMPLPSAEGAYVRLRIDRALGRPPDGGPATPSQRSLWVDRASVAPAAVRWRLLAYVGDLTTAEQDIVARWRPVATPAATRAPATGDTVISVDRHWSLRVPIDAANRGDLLVLARMRDASDDTDLAIELWRHVARQVERTAPSEARALVIDEATHALGWGRGWIALAIVDALDNADVDTVRRAAATAVVLGEAVCQGPCPEDAADLAALERTLGASWIEDVRADVRDWALDRAATPPSAGACPALAEVLAPGSRTPLARAVARYRAGDSAGVGRALVAAIEADPTLGCASRFALPLLLAHGAAASAGRLADFMALGAPAPAQPALLTHTALALLDGQRDRAEQLAISAAAAGDPAHAWRRIARMAHAVDARDMEVFALREALLHAPGLADDAVRRALVVSSLVDASRTWGAGETEAGREATRRIVEDHLAMLPAELRSHERAALHDAVRGRVADAGEARLVEILGRPITPAPITDPDRAMWSAQRLAAGVVGRTVAGPPSWALAFAEPLRMTPLRHALAIHARDWAVRRRAALGLLVLGTTGERAIAAQQLLAMTEPARRAAVERLLLERPAAIAASSGEPVAVVDDDELLLHTLFELDVAVALWPDELPGIR